MYSVKLNILKTTFTFSNDIFHFSTFPLPPDRPIRWYNIQQ